MGNSIITKGSTILIGAGNTDIKAIVIEDFDAGVGEQASEKIEASDGTTYTYVGAQDDNDLDIRVLLTDDELESVLTAVYGAGGTVVGGTEWELKDAGEIANDITITAPATASGAIMTLTAVNAKGAVVRPTFVMQKGYEASVKFICDYWKLKRTV